MASTLHFYFPLNEKKQSQMPDHESKMLNSDPLTPVSHCSLSPPTKTHFMAQSLRESFCENDSKCNNSGQLQLSKCLSISHVNG